MIHAIIVDDEKSGIISMQLLLEKFAADVSVVAATSDPAEGIELINRLRPDVVFLDIQMPVLNGFELLSRLTFRDFQLVFITAHEEHALRALKNNAVDYLLKPIDMDDLQQTISRLKRTQQPRFNTQHVLEMMTGLFENPGHKLLIPTRDGVEYVSPADIIYLEAHSNHCDVKLKQGKLLLANKALKQFEEQLCDDIRHFFRLHNSFIVNMDYVTRYSREDGGYVTMKDEKNIPVSKHRKDELLRMLHLKS